MAVPDIFTSYSEDFSALESKFSVGKSPARAGFSKTFDNSRSHVEPYPDNDDEASAALDPTRANDHRSAVARPLRRRHFSLWDNVANRGK